MGRIKRFFTFLKIRREVKRIRKEGFTMDSFKAIFGWLLKSKWAQGHRRQIGVGLTVATTVLTLAGGPLAGVIPALASPLAHEWLLGLASYFGIVGTAFSQDPVEP